MPKVIPKPPPEAARPRYLQRGAKKKSNSAAKHPSCATIEESGIVRGLQSTQIFRAKQLLSKIATMPYNELYEIVVGEYNKGAIGVPRKAYNPFFAFTAVYRYLNHRDAAFQDVKTPETKEFSVAWGHTGQIKDTFALIHLNLREDIKDKGAHQGTLTLPSIGHSNHMAVVELDADPSLISSISSNVPESPGFPALHWTEHETPESFVHQDKRLPDESVTSVIEIHASSLQPTTPTTAAISGRSADIETAGQDSLLQCHPGAATGLLEFDLVGCDLTSDFFNVNDVWGLTLSTSPSDSLSLNKDSYDDVNANPMTPPIHVQDSLHSADFDFIHSSNYGKPKLSLSSWMVEATQDSTFVSSMSGKGYPGSLLFTLDF